MARVHRLTGMAAAAGIVLLAGCSERKSAAPPPRAHDPIPIPEESSILSIPIDADPEMLRRALDEAIPHTLWTIDKAEQTCVPPARVKIFGRKLKVTPAIGCTIVGTVTRGPIVLRGAGEDIVADVPIRAKISARDVGGVLKGKTATGSAMAHARIRLDLSPDWQPRATVRLHYDWTAAPGIDFLGQRITFTEKADEKLGPIVAKLEADLPRKLARADLRAQVLPLWQRSFSVIELNRDKPPVWMRVSPRKLIYGGYRVDRGRLRLNLGMEALTQTFVGPKPDATKPTPLPPLTKATPDDRFRFFIPVIADYRELEPVILRALVKRSRRPFDLPGLGPVNARFEKVMVYGTQGGRIAVGLWVGAHLASDKGSQTRGQIWVEAKPVNAPGSSRIQFTDLKVTGDTDGVSGDLLLALGNSPGVSGMIANALVQNFAHDLDDLLRKVRHAVERKQTGDFTIEAQIASVQTGIIRAYGEGLYLPVRAIGTAHVIYRPQDDQSTR